METTAFSDSSLKRKPGDADPAFLPQTRSKRNSETFDPRPVFSPEMLGKEISFNREREKTLNQSQMKSQDTKNEDLVISQKDSETKNDFNEEKIREKESSRDLIQEKCEDSGKSPLKLNENQGDVSSVLNSVEKNSIVKNELESEQFFTPLEGSPESIYTDCSNHPEPNAVKKQEPVPSDPSLSSTSTERLTDIQSTQEPKSDSSIITEILEE